MRLVVFGKHQARNLPRFAVSQRRELPLQRTLQIQFFLQPDGHGRDEGTNAVGCIAEIGFQQALELDQRFVIENDVVQVMHTDTALRQAVVDCVGGESRIMLLAGKPLFLCGRDHLAVAQQGCRAVVVVGGYPQDIGIAHGLGSNCTVNYGSRSVAAEPSGCLLQM